MQSRLPTEIWSLDVCPMPSLSLTAQWIDRASRGGGCKKEQTLEAFLRKSWRKAHLVLNKPPPVQTFFIKPNILRLDSPLLYWKVNQTRLPCLARTAAKFLCAPSTSVESERLFCTASNIIDEKRSRLTAEKAEMKKIFSSPVAQSLLFQHHV